MRRKILLAFTALLSAVGIAFASTPGAAHAAVYSQMYAINTNWCITSSSSPVPGSQVFLYQCYGNYNQLWADLHLSDGGYQFEFDLSYQGHLLCLADTGGAKGKGIQFELWNCESPVPYWEDFFLGPEGNGWDRFLVSQTSESVANDGGYLQNYNPIITWTDEPGATFERWWRNY